MVPFGKRDIHLQIIPFFLGKTILYVAVLGRGKNHSEAAMDTSTPLNLLLQRHSYSYSDTDDSYSDKGNSYTDRLQ